MSKLQQNYRRNQRKKEEMRVKFDTDNTRLIELMSWFSVEENKIIGEGLERVLLALGNGKDKTDYDLTKDVLIEAYEMLLNLKSFIMNSNNKIILN